MYLETQGNQTFWRDIPGFWPGYPGGAGKTREEKSLRGNQFSCILGALGDFQGILGAALRIQTVILGKRNPTRFLDWHLTT